MDKNPTRPIISVNIATYNRGRYIREAIDSVLAQSFKNWELVVVDDGSTDNTKQVVAPYLKDSRIKYFKNETNKNISFTRNRALALSQGEFIAILDSDDVWNDIDKLAKQLAFLRKNTEYALIGTNAVAIDPAGKPLRDLNVPLSDTEIRRVILSKNVIFHSSVMYRKNLVEDLGVYNLALNGIEDYDLWLRLGKSHKLANLSDQSLLYRVHGGNISLTNRLRLMQINVELVKKCQQNYPHFYRAITRRYLRLAGYRLLYFFKRKN